MKFFSMKKQAPRGVRGSIAPVAQQAPEQKPRYAQTLAFPGSFASNESRRGRRAGFPPFKF